MYSRSHRVNPSLRCSLVRLDNCLSVSKPAGVEPSGYHENAAVLYCKAQFQYSKILPIKHRIYMLLEEQRKIHRDIKVGDIHQ